LGLVLGLNVVLRSKLQPFGFLGRDEAFFGPEVFVRAGEVDVLLLEALLEDPESEVEPAANVFGNVLRLEGLAHYPYEVVVVHGPRG
jgi:hypothetical protein